MAAERQLVLDANILIRAVLGRRVRQIITDHAEHASFFAPAVAYDDAVAYLPGLLAKRHIDDEAAGAALELLATLTRIVRPVAEEVYERRRDEALSRIEARAGLSHLDRGPGLLRSRRTHLDDGPSRALPRSHALGLAANSPQIVRKNSR